MIISKFISGGVATPGSILQTLGYLRFKFFLVSFILLFPYLLVERFHLLKILLKGELPRTLKFYLRFLLYNFDQSMGLFDEIEHFLAI